MKAYKGHTGNVEYSEADAVYHGRVAGIDAVITFEGDTPEEAEEAFRDSVDDYLAWAERDGFEPEKPEGGRISIRLAPDLHRKAVAAARRANLSLDEYIARCLSQATRPAKHDASTAARQ